MPGMMKVIMNKMMDMVIVGYVGDDGHDNGCM